VGTNNTKCDPTVADKEHSVTWQSTASSKLCPDSSRDGIAVEAVDLGNISDWAWAEWVVGVDAG
jgi:hypothetical protein